MIQNRYPTKILSFIKWSALGRRGGGGGRKSGGTSWFGGGSKKTGGTSWFGGGSKKTNTGYGGNKNYGNTGTGYGSYQKKKGKGHQPLARWGFVLGQMEQWIERPLLVL